MPAPDINEDYLPPKAYLPRNISLLPELEYPSRLNLTDMLLDAHIPERGDKVAIFFDRERITYRQLLKQVNQFANALRELGVGKGDRVVLRAVNIPEYLVWNFACWRIGAIPVLVSHLNRAKETAFKIDDSKAVAICAHSESYADVEKARGECPDLKHVIVHGDRIAGTLNYQDLLQQQSEHAASEEMGREDYARIIYSSGTTGKPKGILTTTEGMLSISDTMGRPILNLQSTDVLGGHPSFSFAFGATFLFIPWRFGAAISITSRFVPEQQFQLVEEHGITLLMAVPTGFRMMLGVAGAEQRYPMPTLRLCHSAGEALPATTAREWQERFGHTVLNSVGSGELHYWLTTFDGMPDDKVGSSGFSVPGYENVIVDEKLDPVAQGTPGELLVRGPVGQMYWRRPDAQMKGVCPPDSRYAGWSRPGLYCTQDADGYFWYQSRLDDMIVTAGYKVPGGEVENALNNHPGVLESAVIGVPDHERGNIIKAFVVLKEGIAPSQQLALELQEFTKQELEPYKYPRVIEFAQAAALPRTVTGKVQRNALRDLELAKSGVLQASSPETGSKAIELKQRSEALQPTSAPVTVKPAGKIRWGVTIDLKRCTGCQSCTLSCKAENGTPRGTFWTWVVEKEEGIYPSAYTVYMPMRCNHCSDPPCVDVCPTGASYQREHDNLVLVDQDQCIGCHSCVVACPYQARSIPDSEDGYYGEHKTPFEEAKSVKWQVDAAQKCTLCAHRIDRGLLPACVETCPTEALRFGDLNDPDSEVSKLVRTREHFRPREELGTDPNVFYLT